MTLHPGTVTVVMPTFNQANFITRALASLKAQTLTRWTLLIIDDGSTEDTGSIVKPWLDDQRIHYVKLNLNNGLGHALNFALDQIDTEFITYLPSDDIYFNDHLSNLYSLLCNRPEAVLAYSGVRHHYNRESPGIIEGYPLQLVQVMHRHTRQRWTERDELVTDDLTRMFWGKLHESGSFIDHGKVTCEWVDHPLQRHKIIQEPLGGLNRYKLFYGVNQPLRYNSTAGNYIDEYSYYRPFQNGHNRKSNAHGLKILLVGELAFNPERVLALEERGHKLYGLWMKDPHWYNYVGPLPFGHIENLPHENWEKHIARIKPDVIYALLNWQAVPFAHEVLRKNPGIPFVWHFKEGPFICMEKGTWRELIDLYNHSDGQIFTSPEMRDWFEQFLKPSANTLVLDGDLPKKEWFYPHRSNMISEADGEIHTVVPGRPIGLHPHTVQALAEHKIHLHFYGDFSHGQWKEWIRKTLVLAPDFLHIHPNCSQENWVKEFSKYDAGWLHFFKSENHGDLMRANWDDLNYPARIATLAAAGLPMLQRDNSGHIVATQSLVRDHGLGVFFTTIEQLAERLYDYEELASVRQRVWQKRMMFTFDENVDTLISFFMQTMETKFKMGRRDSGAFPMAVENGNPNTTSHHVKAFR